jgi:hypothetical protein
MRKSKHTLLLRVKHNLTVCRFMLLYLAMTVKEAVKTLRKNTGESQQLFATRLRMNTRTVQLHEYGRAADVNALLTYWLEAYRQNDEETQEAIALAAFELFPQLPPGYRWSWGLKYDWKAGEGRFMEPPIKAPVLPDPSAPLKRRKGAK